MKPIRKLSLLLLMCSFVVVSKLSSIVEKKKAIGIIDTIAVYSDRAQVRRNYSLKEQSRSGSIIKPEQKPEWNFKLES